MEKNSTLQGALLPRAVNLATLSVVVLATWWSGAQRPASQPTLAGPQPVPATEATGAQHQRQAAVLSTPSTAAAGTTPSSWTQTAATIAREGLQTVGFQPRASR